MNENKIKDRLKIIRKALNIKQHEMAETLDIQSQSTYSGYEKGIRNIPYETIVQIANLGINLHWLITGKMTARQNNRFMQLITETGLSKEDFAKKINKPISFVNAIEAYDIMPSDEFLELTAKTFNKTMDYYLSRNLGNVQQRENEIFNELPQKFLEYLRTDPDFEPVFKGLLALWDKLKSLEIEKTKKV